ncbi:MAG: hypothetical protein WCK11_03300 [Candidatus Falkowbacteria bacterium]
MSKQNVPPQPWVYVRVNEFANERIAEYLTKVTEASCQMMSVMITDEPLPIEVWQVPKSLYDGLKQQAANDTRMHLQFFVPDGKGAMRRHNPQRGVKAQKPVRQAKKDLSKM